MPMTNELVYYNAARAALAKAASIDEVKQIKDKAAAMKLYAHQQKDKQLKEYMIKIQTRATRRLGEILLTLDKAQTTPKGVRLPSGGQTKEKQLKQAGISHATAQRAETVAKVEDEEFEKAVEGGETVTNILRKAVKKSKATAILPDGKFRILYADPPWRYGNSGEVIPGNVADQYPTMSIKQLCDLEIKKIAHDDSVLFMWVTSPLLEECFSVIHAWGFKYKTSFVWNKDRHNFGFYNSVQHEFLLVCTRGSCTPEIDEKIPSVQTIKRTGKHSEKPEEFRAIIDKLYPTGKRIELFSRKKIDGWENYGNEF
jgi:N6-adenosine-specific RNA methylase IME4